MWLDDDQWPYPHHPMISDPDRPEALVPDESVSVEVFQVRPLTWQAAADWCGGTTGIVDGGPVVMVGGEMAALGDYILHIDGSYRVERADGFATRYVPAPA